MLDKRCKLPIDREWLKEKYWKEGLSSKNIAILLGNVITERSIHRKLIKYKIKTRSKKDAIFFINGDRCKISQGYFWIWQPDHHRANGGYVKRSVLTLEDKIGRPLINGELVHHIDGNRMNDDPGNLEISNHNDHPFRIHDIPRPGRKKNLIIIPI